jgi:prepilin-type N-terminal cleavage/methylation domain-containing protein
MSKGFTLAEVLIASAIILALSVAIANFAKESLALNRGALTRLTTEFEGRRALSKITKELRSAVALTSTSSDAVSFILDSDGDGVGEAVRFYTESGALKREEAGNAIALISSLGNASSTPLFVWVGRFVTVTVVSGGKTHSSGITLRNP